MKLKLPQIPIKKQVIILFVIFAAVIVGFGSFNYLTLKNYGESIRIVKESVIRKLSIIGEISLNIGVINSDLLRYMYADGAEEKKLHADKITENLKQNYLKYNELLKLIKSDETKSSLNFVLSVRESYNNKIKEIIENQDPLPASDIFKYEESEIRFLFEEYLKEIQNLTEMVIKDAENEISSTFANVNRTRFIGNVLIFAGILILMINSYFVLKIYKGLTKDYHLLQEEKLEKGKAKEELEKLNKELENKISERTQELEIANKEISVYNSELKKLDLAKDKFISVISHDLRNPISTILASSDALIDITKVKNVDKEDITQFAKIINNASTKVMTQLNELVDWAKNKRVSKIFNPVKLNLWEATNESLQLLEALAELNDVSLENNVSPSLFINADKIMFRSIIQNLVTNSIKFTPASGIVSIDAEEVGEMIEIRIKDTGLGMSEDVKENLFKDKLPMSEEKSKKVGLGLELVKNFIDKHKGTITVESEIGKGSIFKFTVPSAE
ncbi:MAG: ATP-binding protein [Bacteroidota bacterium]|nr:ATP-binding protein [Bacteroidota bacterium]